MRNRCEACNTKLVLTTSTARDGLKLCSSQCPDCGRRYFSEIQAFKCKSKYYILTNYMFKTILRETTRL